MIQNMQELKALQRAFKLQSRALVELAKISPQLADAALKVVTLYSGLYLRIFYEQL